MPNLFSELKRRNVFRVAVAYVIVAWLIVQVADIMQPALLLPDWFTRVVTILLMLGFPLAVVLSWAYELTPEGIKTAAEVDREQSITPQTGRRLDRMIIGMLVLVVGILLADRFLLSPEPDIPPGPAKEAVESRETSIAVMPFVNMSSEPEQDYFSDGISEEILNVLAGVEGLRVTSRSSSFALRDENLDIPGIAARLGVNHVLEGSVRKSGNRVRVTAQLIQVDDDVHLWSDSYDRDLNDIFAIQDEISKAIVAALKEELGFSETIDALDPRQQTSPDAYAAYLRGNHLLNQRTRSSLESAVTEYRGALLLDPQFARAHAQLAVALLLLRDEQYGDTTVTEALSQAEPHIEQALALDSRAAEVQAAAGYHAWVSGNHEAAQAHWDRALEINPSFATIFNWRYRMFSQDLSRPAEAFRAIEHARKLDPLSGPTLFNYLRELTLRGRNEEAYAAVEQTRALGLIRYYRAQAGYHEFAGDQAEAILAYLNVLLIDPDDLFRSRLVRLNLVEIGLGDMAELWGGEPLTITELRQGRTESALNLARQRIARDPSSLQARGRFAIALAAADKVDEAAPVLRELWSMSDGRITSNQGVFPDEAAFAAIYVFSKSADDELVGDIVEALRDRIEQTRSAGIDHFFLDESEGLFSMLNGDAERGIALLKKAAEGGSMIPPDLAYLQPVYAHPEYREVMAIQEKRQAEQRAILFATLCQPGNPYEGIAPMPENTCALYQ